MSLQFQNKWSDSSKRKKAGFHRLGNPPTKAGQFHPYLLTEFSSAKKCEPRFRWPAKPPESQDLHTGNHLAVEHKVVRVSRGRCEQRQATTQTQPWAVEKGEIWAWVQSCHKLTDKEQVVPASVGISLFPVKRGK